MTLNDLIKRAILIKFGYSYHHPDESTIYLIFNYEDYAWGIDANQKINEKQDEADLAIRFLEKEDRILVSFYEVGYDPFVETVLTYNKKEFEHFVEDTQFSKRIPLVFEYLRPNGTFSFNSDDKPMILVGYEMSLK